MEIKLSKAYKASKTNEKKLKKFIRKNGIKR